MILRFLMRHIRIAWGINAHGSHGSHGSLPTAVLDYEILRFLMRHIKGHPWAMRSMGRSVRSVRSVCLIIYRNSCVRIAWGIKAHGSHGSHGSLPTAVLDYEILRFLMRHIKGHPWAMRSMGRSVRSVRSVCLIIYRNSCVMIAWEFKAHGSHGSHGFFCLRWFLTMRILDF